MFQKWGAAVFGIALLGLVILGWRDNQQIFAQAERQRWEYMSVHVLNGADPGTAICYVSGVDSNSYCIGVVPEPLEDVDITLLNQYGAEGWELITLAIDESRLGGIWNYYLRRPLE